jgi:hypothetical protein
MNFPYHLIEKRGKIFRERSLKRAYFPLFLFVFINNNLEKRKMRISKKSPLSVKEDDTPSSIPPLSSLALRVRKLNMDTGNRFIAFIHEDCDLCLSAGLRSET